MSGRIRVLHVDDERAFGDVVAEFLEREDDRIRVESVTDVDSALDYLAEHEVSCVISDFDMPEMDGLQFLQRVRSEAPDLPFILFTGKGSEEVASEAISAGVTDYLQKQPGTEQFELLANRLINAVTQARAQRAVESAERRYQSILHDPNFLGYVLDAEGRLLEANRTSLEYIDETHDAVIGQFFWETAWWDADARPMIREHVSRAAAGDYVTFEADLEKPSNDPYSVAGAIRPVTDDDGNVVSMIVSALDISERRQSEHRLQETRKRYERILNHLSDYVLIVDGMGSISYVSPGIQRVMGHHPDDVVGKNAFEFVHPDDHEVAAEALAQTVTDTKSEVNAEFRANHVSGEYRWVEIRGGNYLDDPAIEGVMVSVRDIENRKKRETELARLRDRYRAFSEHGSDLITVLDETGTIQYQSSSITRVLGYDPSEMIGDHAFDYVHPEDQQRVWEGFIETIESEADGARYDYRFRHADGSWVWLESTGTGQRDDSVDGFVISSRDITERKAYRERLRLLQDRTHELMHTESPQATAEVGVTTASQDLQAPITGVFTFADGGNRLDPVAFVDEEGHFDSRPVYKRDDESERAQVNELIWDVVDTGQALHFNEVEIRERVGTETPVRSVMFFPLEEYGLLIVSSTDSEAFDEQDFALMEILSTALSEAFRRVEREERITDIAQTMTSLIQAKTREDAANRGVQIANDILGFSLNSVHLFDERENRLKPAALTEGVRSVFGDPPSFGPGEAIAWRVFQEGTPTAVDDVVDDPDVYNPDTPVRSELLLPLGRYGILIAGSEEPAAFDDEMIALGELLAGTLVAVFDRVDHETELRQREREVRRQNARLEQFAGVVSHDLRGPLNVAIGGTELLAEHVENEYVSKIQTAHDRMQELIEDLLTLAKSGRPVKDVEEVDLPALVDGCWETVGTADATCINESDGTIVADQGRTKQLLENLVRNAIEHGGDEVTVRIGDLADGFFIEDDGSGFDDGVVDDIFLSGYTTGERGTGFGLAIVQEIIEAHGWEIEAMASADGGARFEITQVERELD